MKIKNVPYKKNCQTIDFNTNKERVGKQNFKQSVIQNCGTTFANRLIDYIKKGGDINNLTPDNIFKK